MSEVPGELKYTRDHEWLRLEDDGTVTVGITDHAQEALGELGVCRDTRGGWSSSVAGRCLRSG